MNKKNNLLQSKKIIIYFIIIFSISCNLLFFSISTNVKGESLKTSGPWSTESYSRQWINNTNFENSTGWNYLIDGDETDLNVRIQNGTANCDITGDKGNKTWIETPDAGGWARLENKDNLTLPDNYGSSSYGWYASHFWKNQVNQSVKIQWQKNFTIEKDMSDYEITRASLETGINASVQAEDLDNGGIDIPGDTKTEGSPVISYSQGDYASFSVYISDIDKIREERAIYHRTTDLGKDGNETENIDPITELNDTKIKAESESLLKHYLEEALKKDNHNFSLTLQIYIWCEDNGYKTDEDNWKSLFFKNLTLSLSYEKKINKFTSGAWEYQGDQINSRGGIIEIRKAQLYFDAKVNDTKIGNVTKNSEVRIYISDIIHTESIKLSKLNNTFINAKESGFDLTELTSRSKNEKIKLKLEVYIADNVNLNNSYKISIDNAKLYIDYNLKFFDSTAAQIQLISQILLIAGIVTITGLSTYYIYYRNVLRYPKSVRKIRKFRKSLKSSKRPGIKVTNRREAFVSKFSEYSSFNLKTHLKNKT